MKREKLFKIGEVMQYTGLSRQTVHNYTLAGLIHEALYIGAPLEISFKI